MLTSSRNQFKGTVASVKRGAVNDEVIIKLKGGAELTAVITRTSSDNLALEAGKEAIALIKASWVILADNLDGIRLSARNQLSGTVKETKPGAVNAEIIVDIGNGDELTAIITMESMKKLGLEKGKPVTALIKASHIIVGVPA